jgi:hypothetical protein
MIISPAVAIKHSGGEDGIRTHDGGLDRTRFPGERIRPGYATSPIVSHYSKFSRRVNGELLQPLSSITDDGVLNYT